VNGLNLLFLFAALLCLGAGGCGLTATVTDFSDGIVEVQNVKTSPHKKSISVIEGSGVRMIKLKEIDKISVFPAGTRNTDGRLYYQVGVLMKDGTKIGYADKAGEKWADSFIDIDGALRGKTENGTYYISFDKIMELDIK
jgi:hypothetical protein